MENNNKSKKEHTNEVRASTVLRALKTAIDTDKKDADGSIDWQGLKDEWEQYFEWVENKGIVLGLEIAKNKWGEGDLDDLLEERAYYQGLVNDFEEDL